MEVGYPSDLPIMRQSSQIIAWWGTSGTLRRTLQRLADCRRSRSFWDGP